MELNQPIPLSLHSQLYLGRHSDPTLLLALEALEVLLVGVLLILKVLLLLEALWVVFLYLRATLLRDPLLLKVLQCGRILLLQHWCRLWFGWQ